MSYRMDRRAYAETFGPTVSHRVRLAVQNYLLKLSKIWLPTVKSSLAAAVIRDRMGQSPISNADGAVDVVITNALNWWGIVKADIGIKDGRIFKMVKLEILIFKNVISSSALGQRYRWRMIRLLVVLTLTFTLFAHNKLKQRSQVA